MHWITQCFVALAAFASLLSFVDAKDVRSAIYAVHQKIRWLFRVLRTPELANQPATR